MIQLSEGCARDCNLVKPLFIQCSPWDIDLNYISSHLLFSLELVCLFTTSYQNIAKEMVYSLSSAIEDGFFFLSSMFLPS